MLLFGKNLISKFWEMTRATIILFLDLQISKNSQKEPQVYVSSIAKGLLTFKQAAQSIIYGNSIKQYRRIVVSQKLLVDLLHLQGKCVTKLLEQIVKGRLLELEVCLATVLKIRY